MRILVVDDDPLVLASLVEALKCFGHEVFSCHRADEALADIREYQVALTDLHLPDGSGLHLAERLVERYPSLPVILMTGWDMTATPCPPAVRMILPKPCSLRTIREAIAQVTAGAPVETDGACERR